MRKKGRPPVDSEDVHVRLARSAIDALDAWIVAQPEPRPSRPEAIRRILSEVLGNPAAAAGSIAAEDMAIFQIMSLKDAASLDDGAAVAFTLVTTNGEMRLALPAPDIGNILSFFASFAGHVGESLAASGRPVWPPVNKLAPVRATGIGFQAGMTPDTTLIALNIAGFALAFEVPNSDLAGMADDLNQFRTLHR